MNALINGLLDLGILARGKNLPASTSKINMILIINKITKAIGEIIPMTFVKEISRKVVNTSPRRSMKKITPEVIIKPNRTGSLLFVSFPDNWLDRYTKKPGYRGKTHNAVKGVNNPSMNEVERSASMPTILTPLFNF